MSGPSPPPSSPATPDRDESTLGGYLAVHERPPAFEGADGQSYTVDILTDETDDPAAPVGGYLVFVCWGGAHGSPSLRGHVETAFLARGETEAAVRAALGQVTLLEVKRSLDALVRDRR